MYIIWSTANDKTVFNYWSRVSCFGRIQLNTNLKKVTSFSVLTCFSSIFFFSLNSNHHWKPLHGEILKKKMHVTGNYVKITLCIILLRENLDNYIRAKKFKKINRKWYNLIYICSRTLHCKRNFLHCHLNLQNRNYFYAEVILHFLIFNNFM